MARTILPGVEFSLPELAGSVGDFGTIIPLMFAAAAVCRLNLGVILFFFGVWFVITGLLFRLPVPVEPMKVIAVAALSAAVGGPELAAAGLLLGLLFFFLGFGKWMYWIRRYVPEPVIRGIQLGLALLLLRSCGEFAIADPWVFIAGAGFILVFFIGSHLRKIPDLSSLALLTAAAAAGILIQGVPEIHLIGFPGLVLPGLSDLNPAFVDLVLPQALLTVTNAILATSLLTRDLFGSEVPPEKLSRTIGAMNLVSVPFGGFPMCHGAGGLAAQYRFGGRTGGSNVLAGIVLLVIGIFFAGPGIQGLISPGIYGALLLFVGIEMGRHGLRTGSPAIPVVMAVAALYSMTVAFVIGMVLVYAAGWFRGRGKPETIVPDWG